MAGCWNRRSRLVHGSTGPFPSYGIQVYASKCAAIHLSLEGGLEGDGEGVEGAKGAASKEQRRAEGLRNGWLRKSVAARGKGAESILEEKAGEL